MHLGTCIFMPYFDKGKQVRQETFLVKKQMCLSTDVNGIS